MPALTNCAHLSRGWLAILYYSKKSTTEINPAVAHGAQGTELIYTHFSYETKIFTKLLNSIQICITFQH